MVYARISGRLLGAPMETPAEPIDIDMLSTALEYLQQAGWYLSIIVLHTEGPHTETLKSIRDALIGEYSTGLSVLGSIKQEQR